MPETEQRPSASVVSMNETLGVNSLYTDAVLLSFCKITRSEVLDSAMKKCSIFDGMVQGISTRFRFAILALDVHVELFLTDLQKIRHSEYKENVFYHKITLPTVMHMLS